MCFATRRVSGDKGTMVSKKVNDGMLSMLAGRIHLPCSLDVLQQSYSSAAPFRHIVLDELFPPALLDQVQSEIPPLDDSNWVHHHDDHQDKYGLRSAALLKEGG